MKDYVIPETKCPFCGADLNGCFSVDDGAGPAEKDCCFCAECGECSIIESKAMRKPTPNEFEELEQDPDYRKNRYVVQMVIMTRRVKEWTKANPDKPAKIQFNFSHKVRMVQALGEALKMHTISVDENGAALLRSMGEWGQYEPTVNMVQQVLKQLKTL